MWVIGVKLSKPDENSQSESPVLDALLVPANPVYPYSHYFRCCDVKNANFQPPFVISILMFHSDRGASLSYVFSSRTEWRLAQSY